MACLRVFREKANEKLEWSGLNITDSVQRTYTTDLQGKSLFLNWQGTQVFFDTSKQNKLFLHADIRAYTCLIWDCDGSSFVNERILS